MYIIRISGGLGNQIFQYVLYNCIKKNYPTETVKIDISAFDSYSSHNGYELEKVFNFNTLPLKATKKEVAKISDEKKAFLHKVRRKLCGRKKTHYKETSLTFNSSIFKIPSPLLLDGYWISWKYCDLLDSSLQDLFRFRDFDNPKNITLAKKIKMTSSVGIHIRRGDYQTPKFSNIYSNICTLDYYKNAIAYFENHIENPKYFIFSDEPDWVKKHLSIDTATVISHNRTKNSFRDMQLFSLCKHNIIANSTFSWWGAYLNQNPDKIIISPDRWLNPKYVKHTFDDIIPTTWLTKL